MENPAKHSQTAETVKLVGEFNCGNCACFSTEAGLPIGSGRCLRFPPSPLAVPGKRMQDGSQQVNITYVFPIVNKAQYCFEHHTIVNP